MNEGDFFADFAGPLGCPSDLLELPEDELKKMRILFVARWRRHRPGISSGEMA